MLVNCSLIAHTSVSLSIQKVSKFVTQNFILLCTKIQTTPFKMFFGDILHPVYNWIYKYYPYQNN
jgi:hypothetical protein